MKIHFLATQMGDASGGAIYDYNFFKILIEKYPDTELYDDAYFIKACSSKYSSPGLIEFNHIYKEFQKKIFDCDYLIMNSRIYTRFIKINLKKILAQYPNVKYVVIHHHNNYMTHSGLLYLIHKHLELKVLKSAGQLIIPNQYVIDQLQRAFNLNNIICLPSSFDKTTCEVSKLNSHNILFVGNVEKRKGLLYGLKAFNIFYQKNRKYKFTIAGKYNEKDPYYKKLKNFIQINGLEEAIIFEGRVTDERLDWLYCNSDLFLFPSLLEGYGWVMIEAMRRGLPVIAFNNSAIPYTVKNGYNGMLVPNKRWNEMGEALLEVFADKNLLAKMQTGALETFSNVPSQENLNIQIRSYIDSWL